ncbi:ROK family transcriptional regulator [Streptomyces sp. 6N223]|uniref:ROK family transcriptional regulator n=1 Tax=Streptomyces sp. 6N223 TaxID=3457412 RepID=UPI003FD2C33F
MAHVTNAVEPWKEGRWVSDGQLVRRQNLASVLRELRAAGPRSRARIAADTGLNKATVSSLVAELAELGLVRDGEVERDGGVGRPGQTVEIDGRVCGLGAEIAVDHLAVLVLDLRGEVISYSRAPLDVPRLGVARTLDELASQIAAATAAAAARGREVAGITAALPGMVETAPGLLRHAPTIGWREVPVADELAARVGESARVRADNAANLAALAEHTMGQAAAVTDLVHITGETGIGCGVITDGTLLRGSGGYGGEIGHMPIGDPAHRCGCGQPGCWETAIGMAALLRQVADPGDAVADPRIDLEVRLAEIRRRAELGDGRTLRGLTAIGTSIGVGAAILVNLFNPAVITLGGYFAVLGDFFLDPLEAELDKRVVLPGRGGCRVELSALGFTAACRGGAHVALEAVLTDPTSVVPATATPTHTAGGTA